MRTITIITGALVFGVGWYLILMMDRVELFYKKLGIALPGSAESLIDLHRMHADYLLLVFAVGWWVKDAYLRSMGHRTAIAICGLLAAIALLGFVGVALVLPMLSTDLQIGAQAGG